MNKFTYAFFAVLMGAICYFVAKKRGMPNPGLWFWGGVLFHVLAVVAITFIAKQFNFRKKGGTS